MQVATKQFIISRRQFIQDDTTVIDLKRGWYLSYHNTMPVFYEPKKDILLIGICWQIDPAKKSPEETIRTCDVQTILQEEETWCGRYILVIEGKVYLDAAGMLTVFYAKYGISNDTKLLNSLVHDTREDWNPDKVMFFYPAPYTTYKKIKRLLPSQIYDIESEEITFRDIFHISHHIDYDDEEKLMADFIELFSSSLKQLYRMFPDKQFLLALSSGYDSRTVLALAHKAGIPFDCFTMERYKMPVGDMQYPPQIAESIHHKHVYIPRDKKNFSQEKYQAYMNRLDNLQMEEDARFYAYGQYDKLRELYPGDIILLRGLQWELAAEYYRYYAENKADIEYILNYLELKTTSSPAQSIKAFWDWCRQHPCEVSDTNRWFWEQICPSWAAETEYGYDIYDNIYDIPLLNCRLFFDMLLQFNVNDRKHKSHQDHIVCQCAPQLSDIPYGANKNFTNDKVKLYLDKNHKLLRRIRKIGLARTVQLYQKRLRYNV